MAVDVSTFRQTFAEFTGQRATDAEVQRHIDLAKNIFIRTEIGTLYLAAHFLELFLYEKLRGKNPGAGVLASESTGPHSESYRQAGVDQNAAMYDTTSYGRQYLLLKRAATGGLNRIHTR